MPESSSSGRRARRHARKQQRRSRVRTVVMVVVALVVVAGVAVAVTGVVSFGGDDATRAAGTVRVAPGDVTRSTTTTVAAPKHACRATLTSDDPLRLWIGGDSLAGSLGPALGEITGATGVVQPYFDSRVSSGLSNPGFFDWPDHATSELERLKPEIVVFFIGTNDYSTPTDGDAWKVEYAKRVEEMLSALGTDGRTVYWVGAPILKDDNMDEGAAAVNAVAAGVVAKHTNAEYVDAHKLFADADGKFAQNLTDETGKLVTMRAGDGVHLTVDGGKYLARSVYTQLDTQCRITAQKVDGHDKGTIQTEGSTQVAPGSKSSGGTVATTPPYSAPSTTSAPVTTQPPVTTEVPTTTAAPTTTVAKSPPAP
jgi:hypothetical protein